MNRLPIILIVIKIKLCHDIKINVFKEFKKMTHFILGNKMNEAKEKRRQRNASLFGLFILDFFFRKHTVPAIQNRDQHSGVKRSAHSLESHSAVSFNYLNKVGVYILAEVSGLRTHNNTPTMYAWEKNAPLNLFKHGLATIHKTYS